MKPEIGELDRLVLLVENLDIRTGSREAGEKAFAVRRLHELGFYPWPDCTRVKEYIRLRRAADRARQGGKDD